MAVIASVKSSGVLALPTKQNTQDSIFNTLSSPPPSAPSLSCSTAPLQCHLYLVVANGTPDDRRAASALRGEWERGLLEKKGGVIQIDSQTDVDGV